MKLYILFISVLLLGVCHLELIGGQASPSTNTPCMERCIVERQNEVADAQSELATDLDLDLDQTQYASLNQQQLAECRMNVHNFDCTLKCMFEQLTVPLQRSVGKN